MQIILLAGITGYLGGYIAEELQKRGYPLRAIARNPDKLRQKKSIAGEILKAELTQPDTIKDCCANVDVVISTVGITRQKDGLTYMDVDYQANMNLLRQAKISGVKKFIYISVLNGEKLRHLKICDAKEGFVEELKKSGLDYCIIRPNGFFSDMTEFHTMATKGRVFLFGGGKFKTNPIHGKDLAAVCVDAIEIPDNEIKAGGPEILTHDQIARTAFEITGGKPKISHIPNWIRVMILKMARSFTGSEVYGPIEFFLTVMSMDMIAPEYGTHTLKEYFHGLGDLE
ncbi:MAG: SDR family oxidoreductase [Desulfobacteraceae bacterium]|nr:SDR family oxidoreductase [Desulfobacteraceae bacterium]